MTKTTYYVNRWNPRIIIKKQTGDGIFRLRFRIGRFTIGPNFTTSYGFWPLYRNISEGTERVFGFAIGVFGMSITCYLSGPN